MKHTPINHIDCFAGPGGICTGFKAAGLTTLAAVEKVKSCVETYQANHSEIPVIHKDIRMVPDNELRDIVAGRKIDILTSGMPCETFSTAGSSSRSFYDFRQQLYSEAIRLATAVDATMILFENVPAIESKRVAKNSERFIVQDILDELAHYGYKHYIKTVLNAVDFGVPQNRNRFFLLATRDESLILRPPIAHHLSPRTVADALVGLPMMEANDPQDYTDYIDEDNDYTLNLKDRSFWKIENNLNGKISYHIAPKHRPGTIERFRLIEPGENLYNLFQKFDQQEIERLQAAKILPKKWFIQRNKRLVLDLPSKTITSHCLDELVHPTLNRGLTVREMARLQGFPDFYDFKGGPFICPHIYETQDKYEQIGDAVPPLLAYAWGRTIIDILNGVPSSYQYEKPSVQEVLF